MDELEDKLGSILNNPQMMQQIMAMAQSLGQNNTSREQPQMPKQESMPSLPEIDPSMLQKIAGFASQNSVSREQQALLSALGPYLSRERIHKLEKAMRAEKMARLASSFLGQGGLSYLTGR